MPIKIGWVQNEVRVVFGAHGNHRDDWQFNRVDLTIEMVK
jgi:hypothetical protein